MKNSINKKKSRPYKVIGATLKFYNGETIDIEIESKEVVTYPIKITEELLLDSFSKCGMYNPPVGLKAKIKYV